MAQLAHGALERSVPRFPGVEVEHGAKNGLSAQDYEMIRAFSAGVVSARRNYYR